MYIAVDFDGTCVTHDFPKVGKDIGAIPVLKKLIERGHKLILNTMRSEKDAGGNNTDISGNKLNNNVLLDAVNWFKENNIPLYGINNNPTQSRWTSSPKVFAHIYIDDAALGCPLTVDKNISNNPFVNWVGISKYLYINNVITNDDYLDLKYQIKKILEQYEDSRNV